MFLPLYPLKRLTIFGLDESDLGARRGQGRSRRLDGPLARARPGGRSAASSSAAIIGEASSPAGHTVTRCPRSAFAKGTAEEETFKAWLKDRYHAPSDDLNQPVDQGRRRDA